MLRLTRTDISFLNWANWIIGASLLIIAMAIMGFFAPDRFGAEAAAAHPELVSGNVVTAFRLTMFAIPLMIYAIHKLLRNLGFIIDSIPQGDAFSLLNADRLREIAWAMLAVCVLDHVWGIIVLSLIGPYSGWTFTLTGWLTTLLLFVLAKVWREGAAMREELEGTV